MTDPATFQPEALLEHRHFVRALARSLVRDDATADDVAQATWLAALKQVPEDVGSVRSWLARIARNQAFNAHRAEARRKERERAASREETDVSDEDLRRRVALQHLVVQAVLDLREPYRTVVLLRYYEGQTAAGIARRKGIPAGTVRSQLARALEQLRERLDRENEGGRAAWSVLLLPLARESLSGPPLVAKLGAAALILALAGVSIWWWAIEPRVETSFAEAPSAVPAPVAVGTDERTAPDLAPEPGDQRAPQEPVADPLGRAAQGVSSGSSARTWVVRGRISAPATVRASDAVLTARLLGSYHIPQPVEACAASDGSFELDLTALVDRWLRSARPSELQLVADHPDCLREELRVPFESSRVETKEGGVERAVFSCELDLVLAACATGVVAKPLPSVSGLRPSSVDATVALFELRGEEPNADLGAIDHAICGEQGRWRLRSARGGSFLVVATSDGHKAETAVVDLVLGRAVEVEPLVFSSGASISGTVRNRGVPVSAGFLVHAKPRSRGKPISIGGETYLIDRGSIEAASVQSRTKADGTFRIEGLSEVEYDLEVKGLPGIQVTLGCMDRPERTVRAPAERVELEDLPPMVEIRFRPSEAPLAHGELERSTLEVLAEGSGLPTFPLDLHGREQGLAIQLCSAVEYTLLFRSSKYREFSRRIGPYSHGEQTSLELDLTPQDRTTELVLEVVTEVEQPVWLDLDIGKRWPKPDVVENQRIERAADGLFRVRGLPPGLYRIVARPAPIRTTGGPTYSMPTEFEVELAAGSIRNQVLSLSPGGRVRMCAKDEEGRFVRAAVQLFDPRGELVPTEFYCHTEGGMYGCGWYLCEQGLNDHPPLAPGHYEFKLTAAGFEPASVVVEVLLRETKVLEIPMHRQ